MPEEKMPDSKPYVQELPPIDQQVSEAKAEAGKAFSLSEEAYHQVRDIDSMTETRLAAQRWAAQVRGLGNPNTQMAALDGANVRFVSSGWVGITRKKAVALWREEFSKIYQDIALATPNHVEQVRAYLEAYRATSDPVVKTHLKDTLTTLLIDETLPMSIDERYDAISSLRGLAGSEFDLHSALSHTLTKLAVKQKFVDSVMDQVSSEHRIMVLGNWMMSAEPGSETERALGEKLSQTFADLPAQQRRATADQLIQNQAALRDDPQNRTVGEFGALAVGQAQAVLDGKPHDVEAVGFVLKAPAPTVEAGTAIPAGRAVADEAPIVTRIR
jgi:hypothetical protein